MDHALRNSDERGIGKIGFYVRRSLGNLSDRFPVEGRGEVKKKRAWNYVFPLSPLRTTYSWLQAIVGSSVPLLQQQVKGEREEGRCGYNVLQPLQNESVSADSPPTNTIPADSEKNWTDPCRPHVKNRKLLEWAEPVGLMPFC
ncbi:hypothetical protein CDAR_420231 [Caerostris darwini]|uniref:Uncharacterized protein n=1 Tax=Caerostris darwini TaxID=1538125 RepID=A0AAV4TTD4_9ARAC|nr:hypothetical protein CDAR_420231 [Caerostris darwini]